MKAVTVVEPGSDSESPGLQVGPGPVGDALLRQLTVPVQIDSGMLPESVVDLAERGLVLGAPVSTYLAGGPRLYEWAMEYLRSGDAARPRLCRLVR